MLRKSRIAIHWRVGSPTIPCWMVGIHNFRLCPATSVWTVSFSAEFHRINSHRDFQSRQLSRQLDLSRDGGNGAVTAPPRRGYSHTSLRRDLHGVLHESASVDVASRSREVRTYLKSSTASILRHR